MPESLRDRIQQRVPFVNVETELYLNLVLLVRRLNDGVTAILKQKKLSLPQYNALRILRGAGEVGLTCGEVGRRMVHRVPDVTRLLDRLETRKLVCRAREAQDRRVIRVWITPLGQEQIAPLDDLLKQAHAAQLSCVDEATMRNVIGFAETVCASLDGKEKH